MTAKREESFRREITDFSLLSRVEKLYLLPVEQEEVFAMRNRGYELRVMRLERRL